MCMMARHYLPGETGGVAWNSARPCRSTTCCCGLRFADNKAESVRNLMTKDRLITVRESADRAEAKRLLHQHRIEKLLVVDANYRCIGLITVKDMEKAQAFPNACKDVKGRLRVAAATGVGKDGLARAEALLAAAVDVIVVDTSHG